MNIKIDNMINLRAFCLEQAVETKAINYQFFGPVTEIADKYVRFVLGNAELPEQQANKNE
jgi:hypothetical protein